MTSGEFRVNLTRHYYRICAEQLRAYETLDGNLREPISCKLSPAKIVVALHAKEYLYEKREECAVIGITFAWMCLEAFFYDYAASKLGDTYVLEHLDKLNLPSKLLIVPLLVCGTPIKKGSGVFAEVKCLTKDRNYLVHFKSKRFDPGDLISINEFHAHLNERFRAALANGMPSFRAA